MCAEAIIGCALEFNCPVWFMSIDLKKAFDTVDHEALFQSLGYHGIDPAYICLLRVLYKN